jgi:hypothetical protein
MEMTPFALKSRADHTERIQPSQDYGVTTYIIDLYRLIRIATSRPRRSRRTAKADLRSSRLKREPTKRLDR